MFVHHAVKDLQKAMIDHDDEKNKLKDLESELLDKAKNKVAVREKRLRRQPNRFQPPHHVDLTECDDSASRGADSEPLKTLVPVKVEKKKKQEKEKKKVEEEKQQEKKKKKNA